MELIIGRRYHVTWSDKTRVWRLAEVDDRTKIATLKTTKGKLIKTHVNTLYDVNANL